MAHYLRPNHRTKTPVRVICFDTESHVRRRPDGSDHTFRLAVASFDIRRETDRAKTRSEWAEFTETKDLWTWVDAHTTGSHATWLYAHNLEYDLTVSGGWEVLEALGWTMVARAAGGSAPWVRWRRDRRSLIMADLHGWVPRKLAAIGELVKVPKLKMPQWEAPDADWLTYCRRDVEVTRTAVLQLMSWVDSDDLGNWSLSSAGQAWRVFRHRFMGTQLLVHDDDQATKLELAAGFGGRREVFRVGRVDEPLIANLDFQNHYMTTAGRIRLPRRLAGIVEAPETARVQGWSESLGVIAQVQVTTDRPCLPVRTAAGVIFPVGTFQTHACWPELSLALELGAEVTFGQVALYHMAPFLVPWAQWLSGQLHGSDRERDRLRKIVLKGWSRELIGKFGQRSSRQVKIAEPQAGRRGVESYFPESGREATEVTWRDDGAWMRDRSAPAENAIPSVFAYVTSAARVALFRALETVGWHNVLGCDTDSLLVRSTGLSASLVSAPGGKLVGDEDLWRVGRSLHGPELRHLPGTLVVKETFTDVEIASPEAMILNGRPRVAGLPSGASRTGPWSFQAESWPGANWQLQHRGAADYVTVVRPWELRTPYSRRQVLPDGETVPWVFSVADGHNVCSQLGIG